MVQISGLQAEILRLLQEREASYARPLSSEEIARSLRVDVSYARSQARYLKNLGLVDVRRGAGGGYYARRRGKTGESPGSIAGTDSLPMNGRGSQDMPDGGTGEPREIVREGLETACDYLPRLITALRQVARCLAEGEAGEAARIIALASGGMEWLHYILTGVERWAPSGIEPDSFLAGFSAYQAGLADLTRALENADPLLGRESIEYAILPFLLALRERIVSSGLAGGGP